MKFEQPKEERKEYNLKYFRNLNPDQVTNECSMVKEDNQRDRCLSYQAALQENVDICNKMTIISNQDLCRQWVIISNRVL